MKQTIVIIHGGNVFASYAEYWQYLVEYDLSLEGMNYKGWKDKLASDLKDDFEILSPSMPNSKNAQYEEWKLWFEKLIPLMTEEVILIGHSLGGLFLAKYLNENILNKKIITLHLVAPPYNSEARGKGLLTFELKNKVSNIENQVKIIYLYHSKDDPIVPFDNALAYAKDLKSLVLRVFDDKGHMRMAEFPELLEDMLSDITDLR